MSQAKVDKYKEEKKNRAKNMKKAKTKQFLMAICFSILIGIGVGYPLGRIWYGNYAKNRAANATISEAAFNSWSQIVWNDHFPNGTGLPLTETDANEGSADEVVYGDEFLEMIEATESDAE